jgi:hypothetical protein
MDPSVGERTTKATEYHIISICQIVASEADRMLEQLKRVLSAVSVAWRSVSYVQRSESAALCPRTFRFD